MIEEGNYYQAITGKKHKQALTVAHITNLQTVAAGITFARHSIYLEQKTV